MSRMMFHDSLFGAFLPGGVLVPGTTVQAEDRADAEAKIAAALALPHITPDLTIRRIVVQAVDDDGDE